MLKQKMYINPRILKALIVYVALICAPFVTYAVWDGLPYAPGATLTPECSPSNGNCTVGPLPVSLGGTGNKAFTAGFIPFGAGTSAMATSSAFFFDSATDSLGIGTTTPTEKLVVSGIGPSISLYDEVENMALVMNASQGLGSVNYGSARIIESDGSTYSTLIAPTSGYLTLTTNGNERLNILANGNVGVNTNNPNEGKVEVKGGTVCVDTNSDNTAGSCIANESDRRLKKNIESLAGSKSLDTILELNPVEFDWRADDQKILSHYPLIGRFAGAVHSVGFIAQEVRDLIPEAIPQETVGDEDVQYLQLDQTKIIPHLVGAIKEMWTQVRTYFAKTDELEAEVKELRARIELLEKQASENKKANERTDEKKSKKNKTNQIKNVDVADAAEVKNTTPVSEEIPKDEAVIEIPAVQGEDQDENVGSSRNVHEE